MTQANLNLHDLNFKVLIPSQSGYLSTFPDLSALLYQDTPLEVLLVLPDTLKSHQQLPNEVYALSWSRRAYGILCLPKLDINLVNLFCSDISGLKRNISSYDPSGDMGVFQEQLMRMIRAEDTSSEDLVLLIQIARFLNEWELPCDYDYLMGGIEGAMRLRFEESQRDRTENGLKAQFKLIETFKNAHFDIGSYKNVTCISTITYLLENDKHDIVQELLPLIYKSTPESENIYEALDDLRELYKDSLQQFSKDLRTSRENPPEITSPDFSPLTRKNQLFLDKYPFYRTTKQLPLIEMYNAVYHPSYYQYKVSVREYSCFDESLIETIKNTEVRTMKSYFNTHPNLTHYIGSYSKRKNNGKYILGVVTEFCPATLIEELAVRSHHNIGFTEMETAKMCECLLTALAQLHEHKVYHYDISPYTIMISADSRIKLGGYSMSNLSSEYRGKGLFPSQHRLLQPSETYKAQELKSSLASKQDSCSRIKINCPKVDIYSLGLSILQTVYLTGIQDYPVEILIEQIPHTWLKTLLQGMLKDVPKQRPKISELLRTLPPEVSTYSPKIDFLALKSDSF